MLKLLVLVYCTNILIYLKYWVHIYSFYQFHQIKNLLTESENKKDDTDQSNSVVMTFLMINIEVV